MATRAEFIQLLVQAKGGVHGPYQQQSFSDVPMSSPYFGDFEEAGKKGWLRGAGDCYGTQPCRANPDDRVNRAEAAALLNRAFGIASRAEAPIFSDNPASAWYHQAIQTAAYHCVLRGDAHDGRVRPSDPMNRAEMAVMISRITKGYTYANRCEDPTTKQRAATRSSSKSSQAPKLINDPANNPHLQCAETDSIYNSQIGKCECADGMIFSSAKNKCLTYTAFCKTKDPSAEWDPARETCYCGGDTEPSADGQKCVPTHSAICKSIDSRAFSYQGQWCVCQHGYKADESRRHCIPADPNSYYEITEREVFPGN